MKLSLAMIVRDEAQNLGTCLGSVKDLVDEMIVVDTGSLDKTVEIAISHGATVERFTWTESFAEARNKSLSLCTGDWILVLDADEMLNTEEHQIIKAAILAPNAMGYKIMIRNYLNSGSLFGPGGNAKLNDGVFEPSASYSHYITQKSLRLFRRQDSPLYVGRIHESVEQWFEEHGHSASLLNATIHHFGKINSERDMAKQPVYLDLARREAADYPDDHIAHANVLQEALMLEDWPTVLEAARTYLKLKSSAPALVYLGGAKALISTGKPNEALEFIAPIDNESTADPAVLELKAEALQALGKIQEAIDNCLLSIDAEPNYTASYIRLAKILDDHGDTENARRILEAGLDQNTQDQKLWEFFVGLSAKYKDARVGQDAWHAIQAVPKGGQGIWHMLVAQVLNSQGDVEEATHVLDLGLAAFPGNLEMMEMQKKFAGADRV
ncbi:MAG: glycosyltransferase [Holophagales bacterium]|jgi:tetratricopeptide (TPR) repeat protein|nr:glycosyltransferase [Holophagales bacterium]